MKNARHDIDKESDKLLSSIRKKLSKTRKKNDKQERIKHENDKLVSKRNRCL